MQISELVQRADVPLATVKYYIREGLLPAGRATSATRADYDGNHLERLRLIRSLTVGAGLPLNRVKRILEVIDHPNGSVYEMLGTAIDALTGDLSGEQDSDRSCPRAEAALASLGSAYNASDDRMAAFVQLENALRAVEEAGMPANEDRLRLYGEHAMAIARAEIDAMPKDDPQAAIQYAVLGTALYEPVLVAIRRLAHQNLAIGVQ